jgi:aminoglycoside phosphotransferase family enzyme
MQDTQDYTIYQVEDNRESASANIIFARHPLTREATVLKILKQIEDERYDLSTMEKRQQCQIEALKWNPKFTPNIYLGLAPIRETLENLEQKKHILKEVGVGPVLNNVEKSEHLLKNKEFALLMRWLPEDQELDLLLPRDAQRGFITEQGARRFPQQQSAPSHGQQ